MKKFTKLTSALVVLATIGSIALPAAVAAQTDQQRIEERKARKTQVVGERVGKVISRAFELYNEEKLDEAIAVLLDVKSGSDFDTAYANRFLGNLYAAKDEKQAIKYLQLAIKPDVLSFTDQSAAMKLLADLLLNDRQNKEAIAAYEAWLKFTGENDADVYLRMANAYYLMQDYPKVIEPADKAIRFAKNPDSKYYQLKMAAYYENKQYPQAVSVLETMVQLFPEEKNWWVYLGNFYTLTESYDKALNVLQLAYSQGFLEKEQEIKLLAQVYANNNIPYKAAALMEKHQKAGLLKKDKTTLTAIASYYQASREFAKSADFYGQLAELTKESDAYRRQGASYLAIQKYNDAIKAYDNALKIDSKDSGRVYMSLVEAYFYQHKYREAYAALMNAKKDPANSRQVSSWESYIKEKAKHKGITL